MVERVRALIIVDVQNDFCKGGSVPVAGGAALASAINDYLAREPGYQHVVATQDFHVDPGDHFSDHPDYSSSWPPHCVAGSRGADFYPDLDTSRIEAVFRKGAYAAAYSGFEGVDENGTPLLEWLRQRGSTRSTSSASPPTIASGGPRRTRRGPAWPRGCWWT